jgi:hypothetical protein
VVESQEETNKLSGEFEFANVTQEIPSPGGEERITWSIRPYSQISNILLRFAAELKSNQQFYQVKQLEFSQM